MQNYTVTLPDGTTNIIVADQAFVEEHFPDLWELVPEQAPPPAFETPPEPEPRQLTRRAFHQRFTTGEKIALELAGLDDPTAPMAQRQQAAAIRVYMRDVELASFVDLDNEDTIAGVEALDAGGLLGTGRAAEILTDPVTDAQAYRP
jgi:hypothetical protein